jgi:hypothetical protein
MENIFVIMVGLVVDQINMMVVFTLVMGVGGYAGGNVKCF